MAILGLSAGYHDAGAAVVDNDGNILFAGHSERYSKIKNDKNLNAELLTEAWRSAPDGIHQMAWYERPWVKHSRQIYSGEKSWFSMPDNPRDHLKCVNGFLDHIPMRTFSHHLSHAAGGFQTSPFGSAICVVADAIGEWDCISIWLAEYDMKGKAKYKKLWSKKYPHSIGLYYSAWTEYVGLKPNEEEYIMMGMAAYGQKHAWPWLGDAFIKGKNTAIDDLFTEMNGFLTNFELTENLHLGIPKDKLVDMRMPWANEDVAWAIQHSTEDLLIRLFNNAKQLADIHDVEGIVYSGGVSLNCAANSKIASRLPGTLPMWIMPNPGDAGSSLGAAALAYGKKLNWIDPYLGTDIPGDYPVKELIGALQKDKIVGVANGRAEFGPRALGNRSLLADPRGHDIKDKVNEIKRRQKFRPFAPVILEEYATEYFQTPNDWNSPYMQYVWGTKDPESFPAITHADYTARVQTVPADSRSGIRQLLEMWYYWSNCPMLLNTSLNIRGEPMVNDRSDADRFTKEYGVKVFS